MLQAEKTPRARIAVCATLKRQVVLLAVIALDLQSHSTVISHLLHL
jgi:hypothetical protein